MEKLSDSSNTDYCRNHLFDRHPEPQWTPKFRDRGGSAGSPRETSAQSSLTVLPSTWKRGESYNEGPVSAYGAGYRSALPP